MKDEETETQEWTPGSEEFVGDTRERNYVWLVRERDGDRSFHLTIDTSAEFYETALADVYEVIIVYW